MATLDPAIGYDWQNWSMIKSLFDGLMDYEPGTSTLTVATLLYLVQMGTIVVHTWFSRIDSLDEPDISLIDLDPGKGVNFGTEQEFMTAAGQVNVDSIKKSLGEK